MRRLILESGGAFFITMMCQGAYTGGKTYHAASFSSHKINAGASGTHSQKSRSPHS
jgi:hypothetical protein